MGDKDGVELDGVIIDEEVVWLSVSIVTGNVKVGKEKAVLAGVGAVVGIGVGTEVKIDDGIVGLINVCCSIVNVSNVKNSEAIFV